MALNDLSVQFPLGMNSWGGHYLSPRSAIHLSSLMFWPPWSLPTDAFTPSFPIPNSYTPLPQFLKVDCLPLLPDPWCSLWCIVPDNFAHVPCILQSLLSIGLYCSRGLPSNLRYHITFNGTYHMSQHWNSSMSYITIMYGVVCIVNCCGASNCKLLI